MNPAYQRLLWRVLREVREADLFAAMDEASCQRLTLGEYVQRRVEAIRDQLVRDAAPVALRELRKCTT